MLYGVDLDAPPSFDNTTSVSVPETQMPQSCLQDLQAAGIDPLDPLADNDHGISIFCHALQVIGV